MILYQEERSKKPIRIKEKRTPRRKIPRIKKPEKSKIPKITTLKRLKNRLASSETRRIVWSNLSLEVHKVLVQKLAQKLSKEPGELRRKHSYKISLDVLDGRTLKGLYYYYYQKSSSKKRIRSFILKELGLLESREKRSSPGREILEALLFNYEGDLQAMAKNPNINTDVETLRSWIEEEGLESLVKE